MDISIGDSVTFIHNGTIVNGDLTNIRKMVDGATLNERVMITLDNNQSFYIDECEGLIITPAYTRLTS
jgi:argonaute-like protein implicated in RNA metabolism and viral defense